ncbi:MAG: hypothetical protein WAU11_00695 [Ignavibacteriaceae bacterium]
MKKLLEFKEVITKIKTGERLILAGDEELLNQLPAGNWIGGTIPYFMDNDGGTFTRDKIFVDEVPDYVLNISLSVYDENSLPQIASDEFEHGYSMIIIPANSKPHILFAEESNNFKNIFQTPLVGWISGIDLNDIGKIKPKVFNGKTAESFTDKCVVMHLELPANKAALLDIINLFEQGDGDVITFETTGFCVSDCLINGNKQNLSSYLKENNIDTKLPLVANYCGAMINTAFQVIDSEKETVSFYGPVFKGVEYKIAKPISDYVSQFTSIASGLDIQPVFTCNCILNYLYSELEGKKTGALTGPMTFGEIAYQLLTQTLVYLTIQDL